jgi:apolipoprotein N-acyltransferase
MNKIRQYFSTFTVIRGLSIALLSSAFIYFDYWGFSYPLLNTVLGLSTLYLLLQEEKQVWFFTGFFVGFFWFWWIALSLQHYGMTWAVPIEIIIIMLSYGAIFWTIAKIASIPVGCCQGTTPYAISLAIKSLGLLVLSYIHPFSFDWLKPELMFIESYIGIEKWQFAIVLLAISLSIWKKQFLYFLLVLFAYQPNTTTSQTIDKSIALITTHTSVQDKWNKNLHSQQFDAVFKTIDQAIANKKQLIIFPESIFPIFLNRSEALIGEFQEKAKHISIVTGGLYWDGKTPRNSTYIFTEGNITIANKIVLVPFGESNPLPDFLSDWVNNVFYDGAVDYIASTEVTDYKINSTTYRNAICFEATSEKLYEDTPQNMIVLSNNGWFTPSIEPTLQKLLLQYYSQKYGTTIYHSVNMSESYTIKNGKVIF